MTPPIFLCMRSIRFKPPARALRPRAPPAPGGPSDARHTIIHDPPRSVHDKSPGRPWRLGVSVQISGQQERPVRIRVVRPSADFVCSDAVRRYLRLPGQVQTQDMPSRAHYKQVPPRPANARIFSRARPGGGTRCMTVLTVPPARERFGRDAKSYALREALRIMLSRKS
jgi:hypothetical protein